MKPMVIKGKSGGRRKYREMVEPLFYRLLKIG